MRTICTETIHTGTEYTDFGVKDYKGRAVGAGLRFTTQVFVEQADPTGCFYEDIKPGTYLTAWGFATRSGQHFGPITGAVGRFRIADNGDEISAIRARDAWVAKYLASAKARAIKNFGAACVEA